MEDIKIKIIEDYEETQSSELVYLTVDIFILI